ncbi:hypothetical protein JYT79_01715 [Cardiobacterium sp. AH-315-I02]|nr:hypothetical protein [Cardiobacterium sp. AH-315-I02]
MPLTNDRNTPVRTGDTYADPVAAATKIFAGSLVCLDAAGNAVPGSVSTTLTARGRADEMVDNTGVAGALTVNNRPGIFKFVNDGSIARADIGGSAYIVDDETVADNNGTSTRSIAGVIKDVDADGVWVQIG